MSNATERPYPMVKCVHQLLEEQAERSPDRTAVLFEDASLSYAELNGRANRLAHYLRELGVGPDARVAICVGRGFEMIEAVLATLKAGGAYVPLDPTYPSARLRFMLEDSEPQVVLTQGYLRGRLTGLRADVPVVDLTAADRWSNQLESNLDPTTVGLTSRNLAYIIYTSGSTDRPKGVMVEHRSVCNLMLSEGCLYGVRPEDKVYQSVSFSFDLSVEETWLAFCAGATLVLGIPSLIRSNIDLSRMLIGKRVTVLSCVPSFLSMLEQDIPSLRLLVLGGEVCPARLLRLWARPTLRVINSYGPTEGTVCATTYECRGDEEGDPPIGRPITNVRVYILDKRSQPVPIGAAGELYIGGAGVTRGYWKRPELTAERFLPDPFAREAGARMYRTGDLGRRLPDGNIEFLGRNDYQVKIRGFRVELAEVEGVLAQHGEIRQAVVVARETDDGDRRLIGYVVPDNGAELTVSELHDFLTERLPDYMVPSAFVFLDRLPLTPSCKVDRAALPAPDRGRPHLGPAYMMPRTTVEKELARIWCDILNLDRIGIEDNFFELGGHSLLAFQVTARIRDRFHVELPFLVIVENPTIRKLVTWVQDPEIHHPLGRMPQIGSTDRTGALPLTYQQEAVWFLDQLAPQEEKIAYNSQITIRFKGQPDISALKLTLAEIVRRHELLRTSFQASDNGPIQVVQSPWSVELHLEDLSAFPVQVRESQMESFLQSEFERVFDVSKPPLVAWRLIRLGSHDHVFACIEHHLVHDGWSLNVFLRELGTIYRAFSEGKPSPLSDLPIQYGDYAVWQRNWLQGTVLDTLVTYWKNKLNGAAPLLHLPADRPRPKVQTFRGAAAMLQLPGTLCDAVREFSRREGVTLFMTMLTAFAILLYLYTQQTDIVIGSSTANRRLRETEQLLGMFVNTIVLRTNLGGDPTFREATGRVREMVVEAQSHQDLPFVKLVEAMSPPRNASYNPIFQVQFNFHDSQVPSLEFPGLRGTIRYEKNKSAKFDLAVVVIPFAEQHVGSQGCTERDVLVEWEYNTDLFDRSTIERLHDHYRRVLESVVANADQHLSEIQDLSNGENDRTLVTFTRESAPKHR